jgi:hypothetical protein
MVYRWRQWWHCLCFIPWLVYFVVSKTNIEYWAYLKTHLRRWAVSLVKIFFLPEIGGAEIKIFSLKCFIWACTSRTLCVTCRVPMHVHNRHPSIEEYAGPHHLHWGASLPHFPDGLPINLVKCGKRPPIFIHTILIPLTCPQHSTSIAIPPRIRKMTQAYSSTDEEGTRKWACKWQWSPQFENDELRIRMKSEESKQVCRSLQVCGTREMDHCHTSPLWMWSSARALDFKEAQQLERSCEYLVILIPIPTYLQVCRRNDGLNFQQKWGFR